MATSDTPRNKHTASGDMRGRSIRVCCLLDPANGTNKITRLGSYFNYRSQSICHSFYFSFPLNQGELYNTFGDYAEDISAGRLCLNTYTSCSVLFNLRIYGIHGLVIGETEFIGGSGGTDIHFTWCFHLAFSFLLSLVVARSHQSVRVDHS
jgi:hypothetical protein